MAYDVLFASDLNDAAEDFDDFSPCIRARPQSGLSDDGADPPFYLIE